jgi:hypothetical protein
MATQLAHVRFNRTPKADIARAFMSTRPKPYFKFGLICLAFSTTSGGTS